MRHETPAGIVSKSRIKLLKKQPFFGTLAMNLITKETPGLGTWDTDGIHVRYDPEIVTSEYKEFGLSRNIASFAHEVGHVHLLHMLRGQGKDQEVWNQAGDYVINLILQDCGLDVGDDWLISEEYRGMSTDQVYRDLMQNPSKQKPRPRHGQGQGQGGPKGGGHCFHRPAGKNGRPMDKQGKADLENKILNTVAQAAQAARMAGKLPGSLETMLDAILNPPEPWPDYLREWMTHQAHDDYNWDMADRVFLNRNIYLPSLNSVRMGPVVIAVDTSGSCIGAFTNFMSQVSSILEDCKPEYALVLYIDTRVAKAVEYTHEDLPLDMTIYGGGGTSFVPAFTYVEEHDIEPACMIYFTDTYGDFPASPPDYPVLWACVGKDTSVPFGQQIEIPHDGTF